MATKLRRRCQHLRKQVVDLQDTYEKVNTRAGAYASKFAFIRHWKETCKDCGEVRRHKAPTARGFAIDTKYPEREHGEEGKGYYKRGVAETVEP